MAESFNDQTALYEVMFEDNAQDCIDSRANILGNSVDHFTYDYISHRYNNILTGTKPIAMHFPANHYYALMDRLYHESMHDLV